MRPARTPWRLWWSAAAISVALWFWYTPMPYDATLASAATYWSMHITLFGGSILLWHALLDHPSRWTGRLRSYGATGQ